MVKISELSRIINHYLFHLKKFGKKTIHCEAIYDDDVWRAVKRFVKSRHRAIWFVLTPVNYDFVKVEYNPPSKEEWEKIITKRYKWLKGHQQELQLHVHLKLKPEYIPSKRWQIDKITTAYYWMKDNLKVTPTMIAFGWWSYNRDSVMIAKSLGLEVIKRRTYWFTHDFDKKFLREG